MSGTIRYDSENEKSQEDKFEDAVADIGSDTTDSDETGSDTATTATDSDDTEKLIKDFEILQLSADSEESRDSPSSTSSWEKCGEHEEIQKASENTEEKKDKSEETGKSPSTVEEPIAHCSRNILNLTLPGSSTEEKKKTIALPSPLPGTSQTDSTKKRSKTVKTSAEWKELVEKYKADRKLNEKFREISKNLESLRAKKNETADVDSGSSSEEESDSDEEIEKTDRDVVELVWNMMDRPIMGKNVDKEESNLLYRALSVSLFLKTMGGKYSKIIIQTILDMLDDPTKALWLDQEISGEGPTFNEFISFLYVRCAIQDNLDYVSMGGNVYMSKCYCCQLSHKMYGCAMFRSRGVGIRWKMTKENRLCSNCLRGRHRVRECFSYKNCRFCGKRHNSALHKHKRYKKNSKPQE